MPPLVIVNVPPVISSTESFPSRALAANARMASSICAKVMPSALRSTGTTRPRSVPTAMETSA